MFKSPAGQKVRFHEFEKSLAYAWEGTAPEIDDFSTDSHPISSSSSTLRDALRWAWLSWLKHGRFGAIYPALHGLVMRSIGTAKVKPHRDAGDQTSLHDWYLLNCGVLSGDRPSMELCAKAITCEVHRDKKRHNRNFAALCGIIRSRILGDSKAEQRFLAKFEESPQTGPDMYPARSLVRAFVARDYPKLDQAVIDGAMMHWSERYLPYPRMGTFPVRVSETKGELVLNLFHKDSFATWAYSEAVFAKLAMMDGARITHDDLWFPHALVRATPDAPLPISPPASATKGRATTTSRRRTKTTNPAKSSRLPQAKPIARRTKTRKGK